MVKMYLAEEYHDEYNTLTLSSLSFKNFGCSIRQSGRGHCVQERFLSFIRVPIRWNKFSHSVQIVISGKRVGLFWLVHDFEKIVFLYKRRFTWTPFCRLLDGTDTGKRTWQLLIEVFERDLAARKVSFLSYRNKSRFDSYILPSLSFFFL